MSRNILLDEHYKEKERSDREIRASFAFPVFSKMLDYYGSNPAMQVWINGKKPFFMDVIVRLQRDWEHLPQVILEVMADQPSLFRGAVVAATEAMVRAEEEKNWKVIRKSLDQRKHIEDLVNQKVRKFLANVPEFNLLAGNSIDHVPMINDETLWGECQKIADYAPRLAEPIKWIVSECVRAYSEAIFVEIGKVAGAVRNALQTSTTSDERKLEWLARAQDCSRLASKVYSHGATYFYSGVSATGYDAIRVVAKEGAEWALKTYASRIGFEADSEWDKFAKSGLLARAVLGNQKATRILDALKAGAFTISSKGQHDGMGGRHVALVLRDVF